MGILFFIPLTLIAFYESTFDTQKHTWMRHWLRGNDEGEQDYPETRDPGVDDDECQGKKISSVPFEDLIKRFPDTQQVRFL
jgi:hypothetical protein